MLIIHKEKTGKTPVTRSRYTKLERVNVTKERKRKRKKKAKKCRCRSTCLREISKSRFFNIIERRRERERERKG